MYVSGIRIKEVFSLEFIDCTKNMVSYNTHVGGVLLSMTQNLECNLLSNLGVLKCTKGCVG